MNKKCLVGAVAAVISGGVVAVEPAAYKTDSGINITPLLQTGLKYDNNILSQATAKDSSAILTIAPSVNFLLDDGLNQYQLDAGIASGTYLDSSDDNYVDAVFGLSSHLEPSSSSRFDISLLANWFSEPRGTGITEVLGSDISEPLRFAEQTAAITYEYGLMSSKARVAFDGKYYNKGYHNFDNITRVRNYDSLLFGATFFYSTNSRTDAFIELNRDAIRYDVADGLSRDSDDVKALLGVKWQATALTTGSIKLGYQRKDFTASGRENFSGVSWDATVDWQPLTYSALSFTTSRMARDPNVEGDYIRESLYGINWTHQWSDLFSSTLDARYIEEDYTGVSRADDSTMLTASLSYSMLRWLDVAIYVESLDKDSTRDTISFDKTVVGLNFTISM